MGLLTALCRPQERGRQCAVKAFRLSFWTILILNLLVAIHLNNKVKIFLKLLPYFMQKRATLLVIYTSNESLKYMHESVQDKTHIT